MNHLTEQPINNRSAGASILSLPRHAMLTPMRVENIIPNLKHDKMLMCLQVDKMKPINLFLLNKLILACCLVVAPVASVDADTVAIPVGQQAGKNVGNVPRSGMKKTSVVQYFGNPIDQQGPIGDPPISTWVYNGFTVYFEYDRVIHSVIQHRPQTP